MPRVPVNIQKSGDNSKQKKQQLAPGACVKPMIQAVAYGKTHQGAADKMQTNSPGSDQSFHAALLLFKKILKHRRPNFALFTTGAVSRQ
jgi:hypothetical protein